MSQCFQSFQLQAKIGVDLYKCATTIAFYQNSQEYWYMKSSKQYFALKKERTNLKKKLVDAKRKTNALLDEMETNLEACEIDLTDYLETTSRATNCNLTKKAINQLLHEEISRITTIKTKFLMTKRCLTAINGEVVDSWEQLNNTAPDTEVCPICMVNIDVRLCTKNDLVLQTKCCKKKYHASCLKGLHTTTNNLDSVCPTCRGVLSKVYSIENKYCSINKLDV
jgi:hypothetical protein